MREKTYLNSNIRFISDFSPVQDHCGDSATLFTKFVYCYTYISKWNRCCIRTSPWENYPTYWPVEILTKWEITKVNTEISLKIALIFCFKHNWNLQQLIVGENISYNLLSFYLYFWTPQHIISEERITKNFLKHQCKLSLYYKYI